MSTDMKRLRVWAKAGSEDWFCRDTVIVLDELDATRAELEKGKQEYFDMGEKYSLAHHAAKAYEEGQEKERAESHPEMNMLIESLHDTQVELEATQREVDRLQRGDTIESDYITKRELDLQAELEKCREQLSDAQTRLASCEPQSVPGQRFWDCKIGPAPFEVPSGGDSPLRRAVEQAFFEMFGEWDRVCFSGWAGNLTDMEREAFEYKDEQDIVSAEENAGTEEPE